MPSLKEIARKLNAIVTLGEDSVRVRGLSGDEISNLLAEFPVLGQFFGMNGASYDLAELQAQAPKCMATIIATGVAELGTTASDADIEDARLLPGAAQLDLVAAIAGLSLPRAIVRPFVELIRDDGGDGIGRDLDTRS